MRPPNGNLFGEVKKPRGRQLNRNAAWPVEKGGHQQCRHRTWETKVKKLHGRQLSRNVAWPAEKGGHQQYRHRTWETKVGESQKCCMASAKGRKTCIESLTELSQCSRFRIEEPCCRERAVLTRFSWLTCNITWIMSGLDLAEP